MPNVELAWKLDDVFMQARRGLYPADVREQADPPACPTSTGTSPGSSCDRPRIVLSEQVTALPEDGRRSCDIGSAVRRPASPAALVDADCAPSRSASAFRSLLILLWDRAVAMTGTRLVPSPREVAVMMYDFSFGGIYDDAFSATILTHVWKSMTARLWRLLPGRADRHPARPDDRAHQAAAAAARSHHQSAAADPGHRMAAAVDDLLRARDRMRRSSWSSSARSTRSCSTPSSACARSTCGCSRPPRCSAAPAPPCSVRSCSRPRCRRSSTGCASRTALRGS